MAGPKEITFKSARDLINYVSPLNSFWDTGEYIFRGQPSDRYTLTASICRRGEGSFAHSSPRKVFADTFLRQLSFELEVLRRFLKGCDRSGLVVPGYSHEIKNKMVYDPEFLTTFEEPWPSADFFEIMAVAQHYDVPTRLLDWTERSFVACYFAASTANFELDEMEMPKIAIWALDTAQSKNWQSLSIIRTPGGTSKNQAAQSGLFTTHNVERSIFENAYKPEALEAVQEIYEHAKNDSPLLKLTLPVDQAPELLTLCSALGVDGSTLFPGYQGVAKSVKDWVNVESGVRPSAALIQAYEEYNAEGYFD